MYNIPKKFVLKYNKIVNNCIVTAASLHNSDLPCNYLNNFDNIIHVSWNKKIDNFINITINNFDIVKADFSTIEILYLFSIAETLKYVKKSDILNKYFTVDEDLVKELRNCSPNKEMNTYVHEGNMLKLLSFSLNAFGGLTSLDSLGINNTDENINIYKLLQGINESYSIGIRFKGTSTWVYTRFFICLLILKILYKEKFIKIKSNELLEIE